jgi:hypothetical protein
MKTEEPIRHALLGQLIAEPQVDTEEIAQLTPAPKKKDIPFNTIDITTQTNFSSTPLSRLPPITSTSNLFSLSSSEPLPSLYKLQRYAQRKRVEADLISKQFKKLIEEEEAAEPPEPEDLFEEETPPEVLKQINSNVEETPPEVLKQSQERGPAELITETPSEPFQPLSQASDELGFGGLNETIQTSVGQILPPEPISQGALEVKEEKKKKGKTILKPIEPPPAITAQQEIAPSILQDVRAADQYVTEQLVKDEPPGGAPQAEARVVEPKVIRTQSQQVKDLWDQLKAPGGPLEGINTSRGPGKHKSTKDWIEDIRTVPGYETYVLPPKQEGALKPGPQSTKTTKVAVATLITDA